MAHNFRLFCSGAREVAVTLSSHCRIHRGQRAMKVRHAMEADTGTGREHAIDVLLDLLGAGIASALLGFCGLVGWVSFGPSSIAALTADLWWVRLAIAGGLLCCGRLVFFPVRWRVSAFGLILLAPSMVLLFMAHSTISSELRAGSTVLATTSPTTNNLVGPAIVSAAVLAVLLPWVWRGWRDRLRGRPTRGRPGPPRLGPG